VATLIWLHLSDLHAGRPKWDAGRVTATLVADLKRLAGQGLRPDLLFFTGDAAFGRGEKEPVESLDQQFDFAADLLTAARQGPPGRAPAPLQGAEPQRQELERHMASLRF
jgi:3',5'-cyclic AMP phosphodiesterase CpdA